MEKIKYNRIFVPNYRLEVPAKIKFTSETFSMIWIEQHDNVLRERYISFLIKNNMCDHEISFEEFAIGIFEHAAFAVEHNLN